MVIVETKKTVADSGVLGYIILKVDALTRKELPTLYINKSKPCVWKDQWDEKDSLCINSKGGDMTRFTVDKFYPVDIFDCRWERVKKAEDNLREVRYALKLMEERWHGHEVFKY